MAFHPGHLFIAAGLGLLLGVGPALCQGRSDADIRQGIMALSIASYPGACPCPYNVMANGRRCGGRSAYSRPGGAAPVCYPSDVTDDMIRKFKRRN